MASLRHQQVANTKFVTLIINFDYKDLELKVDTNTVNNPSENGIIAPNSSKINENVKSNENQSVSGKTRSSICSIM